LIRLAKQYGRYGYRKLSRHQHRRTVRPQSAARSSNIPRPNTPSEPSRTPSNGTTIVAQFLGGKDTPLRPS
jgi:hypothetical protein